MFGFGVGKLLFTVLVVAAVWYGFRYFTGKNSILARKGDKDGGNVGGGGAGKPQVDAEDLSACPVCGTYVRTGDASSCGRGDCPYPG